MQVLANMQGQYPLEEIVSDLPSIYFITLRTEIMQTINSGIQIDKQILSQIGQIYAKILEMSIKKLAFPSKEIWLSWNLEEREQFESYRKTRSEASYDSYHFSAAGTLDFLNQTLEQALGAGDVNR